MITVKNNRLFIPEGEEYLGFQGDNLHQTKEILIENLNFSDNLIFRLYLKFDNKSCNFFTLDGCQHESGVLLTWKVKSEQILKSGYVLAQLKVFNGEDEIFHSSIGCFTVAESIDNCENFNNDNFYSEFAELETELNNKYSQIEDAQLKAPIIGTNGNWFLYNNLKKAYADSGKPSKGEKGDTGSCVPDDGSITYAKTNFLSEHTDLRDVFVFTEDPSDSDYVLSNTIVLKTNNGIVDYSVYTAYITQLYFRDSANNVYQRNGTSGSDITLPLAYQTYNRVKIRVHKNNVNGFSFSVPSEYAVLGCDTGLKDMISGIVSTEFDKSIIGVEKITYLSDLNWTSAVQDFETTNKDLNCKGVRIKLKDANGSFFTCPKGIGTHANSDIRYSIKAGEYDVFESFIGVDAVGTEECSGSSFRLYYQVNGGAVTQLYPEIRELRFKQNTAAKYISVDIPSDATTFIIETKFNDADACAWTNWGMARFVKFNDKTKPSLEQQIQDLSRSKLDSTNVAANIPTGSLTGEKIANSTLTGSKIAPLTITGNNIANYTISGTKLMSGTVNAAQLGASAVTESKLASSAVTTLKIKDKNVTTEKLADGVVTYAKTNFLSEHTDLRELFTFTEDPSDSNYILSNIIVLKTNNGLVDYSIYSGYITQLYFRDSANNVYQRNGTSGSYITLPLEFQMYNRVQIKILKSLTSTFNFSVPTEYAVLDCEAGLKNMVTGIAATEIDRAYGLPAISRYGVSFGGSANSGATVSRLYNAAGLVANVGTDTQNAINNFDNIYPWSARRRCCGFFDSNGNFIVNAYKGEPGYIEDGTNGEVWVEHSLFFYKHSYTDDGAEEIVISATQLAGFFPAPIFINSDGTLRQKAYTAAYPMATVNGVATSRAGVFPDVYSLNSAMTAARTLGDNYTVTTTAEWYTECLYMWVEFATRNLQSIMMGASNMPYSATDTAAVAEEGANRIIVTNAVAEKYIVGQTILIGTSLGSSDIANNRIVTAIEVYDADNKAICFDGNAVNIAVGNIVCSAAWVNGSCNSVISSSGSPVSNTDGKHNCVYRGKETPYGNVFESISDVLFKREGAGTTEDPYTYEVYFLSDPTKYADGALTADYTKLNYTVPMVDGYVKELGIDNRFPWLRIPSKIGANSNTYYGDFYCFPRSALCAAHVGGAVNNGLNNGLCFWLCDSIPSRVSVKFCARLSYRQY